MAIPAAASPWASRGEVGAGGAGGTNHRIVASTFAPNLKRNLAAMTRHSTLKAFRALLAMVLLAVASSSALAYQNETFGFRLDLAGGPLAQYQSVITPEGITLASPDGGAVIEVFGSWNEAGQSLAAIAAQARRDLPEARVTYDWIGSDAAVLSGYQAGDIFYMRIAMSPDGRRIAVLNMIYAPELKRQLDPLVTRLSRSLSIR
jgi:hypothetical protein